MRKTKEQIAREIAEIAADAVKNERIARKNAYDDYLHGLKPGETKKAEPETDFEFSRMFPDAFDSIQKRRLKAKRDIDRIVEQEKAEIRRANLKPLPADAAQIVQEWKSYTPDRDQLLAFLDSFGEYMQSTKIVNKVAEDAGLNFTAIGRAENEMGNLDRAAGMAKGFIGHQALMPSPEKLETDTLSRIEGKRTGSFYDGFCGGIGYETLPPWEFDFQNNSYVIIDGKDTSEEQ